MLDPVTAVGIAASAVGVVDFSIKIVATCKAIHGSATGVTSEIAEIKQAHQYLPELLRDFNESIRKADVSGPLSLSDQSLIDTSKQCLDVATELQTWLNKIAADDTQSKRQLFKRALKMVSGSQKLKQMQEKLEKFQIVLDTKILLDLRKRVDLNQIQQSDAFAQWNIRSQEILRSLAEHKSAFTDQTVTIQQLQEDMMKHTSAEHETTRLHSSAENQATRALLKDEICKLHLHNDEQEFIDKLLQALMFPEINSRREEIPEAHEKTCQWIFERDTKNPSPSESEESWVDFPRWLQEGSNIYWIQGKAGSGKSTLMNYICDDPRTLEGLTTWAHGELVMTPTFFFWSSGTFMQKSIAGMLRSLIFQVLQKLPYLASSLPLISRHFTADAAPVWTERRLRDGLLALLQDSRRQEMICFFIDGLDEFDGEGMELSHLLKRITNLKGVKACVSSRPLNVFQCAFRDRPQLRMEDFNRQDIKKYVWAKLGDPNATAPGEEDDFRDIANSLCNMAQGVFLWIRLAVASLLRGKQNQDDIRFLKQRLDELPLELEKMYDHMLQSVEPVYRDWTLRLLYYSMTPKDTFDKGLTCSILQLHFIMNPDVSLDVLPKDILTTMEKWYKQDSAFVNAACLGLVQINRRTSNQYGENWMIHDQLSVSHRTVRSFISEKYTHSSRSRDEKFMQWDRDMQSSALKCAIWLAKTFEHCKWDQRKTNRRLEHYIYTFLSSLGEANPFENEELQSLMDELDPLMQSCFERERASLNPIFTNPALPTPSCLTLAVKAGYRHIAKQAISASRMPERIFDADSYTYLLSLASDAMAREALQWSKAPPPWFDMGSSIAEKFEFIQFLLELGADPNFSPCGRVSAWNRLLQYLILRSEYHPGNWPSPEKVLPHFISLLNTFIAKGASKEPAVKADWYSYSEERHRSDRLGEMDYQNYMEISMKLSPWIILSWLAGSDECFHELKNIPLQKPASVVQIDDLHFSAHMAPLDALRTGSTLRNSLVKATPLNDAARLKNLSNLLNQDVNYVSWRRNILLVFLDRRVNTAELILHDLTGSEKMSDEQIKYVKDDDYSDSYLKNFEEASQVISECLQAILEKDEGDVEIRVSMGPEPFVKDDGDLIKTVLEIDSVM